ncbi:MAG TPA: hypothetical protein PLJ61_02790 [Bacteroidales bacterium]|mgnify:CR=1 FL=1|jgi:hypothetical protein|nr:hypothetical protein [Bacteroidales bacterium]HNZ46075.1 hypothetical protein [Bacteroidales bacterium]HOG32516.1 hypothetical protein [Bacteroidales bacterium]HPY65369.1 hypothetical protein [Bacteroidales bacterium]HQM57188.1 hypothetical protein [Bacteroidales bacterium]
MNLYPIKPAFKLHLVIGYFIRVKRCFHHINTGFFDGQLDFVTVA